MQKKSKKSFLHLKATTNSVKQASSRAKQICSLKSLVNIHKPTIYESLFLEVSLEER